MKTLIINSYAGSLTIAAQQEGAEIIGSYEDSGFGLPFQRLNFPGLDFKECTEQWPRQSLKDAIVLAHPPCSAFSVQNSGNYNIPDEERHKYSGIGAEAFQCTVKVLDYAMGHKAKAIAVESVRGALEGARAVHDGFASKYGYHVFRLLQNAKSFGVPQDRPRFWAIFVRKDLLKNFAVLNPKLMFRPKVVKDCLDYLHKPEQVDAKLVHDLQRLRDSLSKAQIDLDILEGSQGFGMMQSLVKRWFKAIGYDEAPMDREQLGRLCLSTFTTRQARVLDPNGSASTLLKDSWWLVGGRNLTAREYKKMMGFPATYKVPENLQSRLREFLSKGVCPPVARWIYRSIRHNLEDYAHTASRMICQPGHVLEV